MADWVSVNTKFEDYFCLRQSNEAYCFQKKNDLMITTNNYKITNNIGEQLHISEETLEITKKYLYFICYYTRDEIGFKQDKNIEVTLSCLVNGKHYQIFQKTGRGEVDIEDAKKGGVSNYAEGDTNMLAIRIPSSILKGIGKVEGFCIQMYTEYAGRRGAVIKKYTPDNIKSSMYWSNSTVYTSNNYPQGCNIFTQLSYGTSCSVYDTYNNDVKTNNFFNTQWKLSLLEPYFLSNEITYPDSFRFYYYKQTYNEDTAEVKKSENQLLDCTKEIKNTEKSSEPVFVFTKKDYLTDSDKIVIKSVQAVFKQDYIVFEPKTENSSSQSETITLSNFITISDSSLSLVEASFAPEYVCPYATGLYYNYFPSIEESELKKNSFILHSAIVVMPKELADYPYDLSIFSNPIFISPSKVQLNGEKVENQIQVREKNYVTIGDGDTSPEHTYSLITGNSSINNKSVQLLEKGNYTFKITVVNKFTGEDEEIVIHDYSEIIALKVKEEDYKYILCSDFDYKIKYGTYDVPGNILIKEEQLEIEKTDKIARKIFSCAENSLISISNFSYLTEVLFKTEEDAIYTNENEDRFYNFASSCSYNYLKEKTLGEDYDYTVFLQLSPQFTGKYDNDKTISITSYPAEFQLGRIKDISVKDGKATIKNTKLEYILSNSPGDRTPNQSINSFINNRIINKKYFSLARDPGNSFSFKEYFIIKITPENSKDIIEITVIPESEGDISKLLEGLKENKLNSLSLSDLNFPGELPAGRYSMSLEYFYQYDNNEEHEERTLFSFSGVTINVEAGSRALGVRKQGIIVNPKKGENLSDKDYCVVNIPGGYEKDSTSNQYKSSGKNGLKLVFEGPDGYVECKFYLDFDINSNKPVLKTEVIQTNN